MRKEDFNEILQKEMNCLHSHKHLLKSLVGIYKKEGGEMKRKEQGEFKFLNKKEVLARLCEMCSLALNEVFEYKEPADCFCEGFEGDALRSASGENNYRFSPNVMEFIEEAVERKVKEVKFTKELVKEVK